MKRIKLLPSVLMLIMCFGVLAMGVYAFAPSVNTVAGTVTVKSSAAEVAIECFVNGTSVKTFTSVRAGEKFILNDLEIDTAEANTIAEIPPTIVTFKITNKSNKPLGAYFYKTGSSLADDGYATADNIMVSDILKNSDSEDVVDAVFSSYSYIKEANTTDTYDERNMAIWLYAKSFDDADQIASFKYELRLEPWVTNAASAEDYEGKELLKTNDLDEDAVSDNSTIKFIATEGAVECPGDMEMASIPELMGFSFCGSANLGWDTFSSCSKLVSFDADGANGTFNIGRGLKTIKKNGVTYMPTATGAYKVCAGAYSDVIELEDTVAVIDEWMGCDYEEIKLSGITWRFLSSLLSGYDTGSWEYVSYSVQRIVLKGGDGSATYTLPTGVEGTWYTTADFSGESVAVATQSTEDVTYYFKASA